MDKFVVWFDLPVRDMNRAKKFYEKVFNCSIDINSYEGAKVGVMTLANGSRPGCLWETEEELPSSSGIMVYFSVQGRLEDALKWVVQNGGRIVSPKHSMGEYGYRSIIRDTEGNRLVLHSY